MTSCPNCHNPLEAEGLKYCPTCQFRFDENAAEVVNAEAFMNEKRTIPRGLLIAAGIAGGLVCLCLLGWLFSTIASARSGPSTPVPTHTLPSSGQTKTAVAVAFLSRTPTPTRTTTPTITPTRTTTPVPSPTPNFSRAVFSSDRSSDQGSGLSIFIMDGNGANQKSLTKNLGGDDACPAVSPNKLSMLFCSTREKPGTQDLYLQDLKTGSVYQVTGTPGKKNASPAWFPDSFHLAFTSNRDGKWAVYLTDAESTDVKQVVSASVDLSSVSVSPDGTMLAYICGKELCMSTVNGTNTQTIYKNGIQKDHPVWSPDGYKVVFSQRTTGTKSALFLLDLTTLSASKLVDNGNNPAWSPDGRNLMYASDLRGRSNIYVYELATGNIFPVTNSTKYSDYYPFWF